SWAGEEGPPGRCRREGTAGQACAGRTIPVFRAEPPPPGAGGQWRVLPNGISGGRAERAPFRAVREESQAAEARSTSSGIPASGKPGPHPAEAWSADRTLRRVLTRAAQA